MRRAFFFIVAVCLATPSFASIPRASARIDAPSAFDPLPETRIRVSGDLAPFERPASSLLSRALRQGYEQASTTNASGLARFLSVDPVLDVNRAASEPQRWNRYAYVVNIPINRIDPDGRADRRSAADRAILEDPDVLADVAIIMDRTGFQNPLPQRVEHGAIITDLGGGDYGTDGVVTSASVTHVDFRIAPSGRATTAGQPIAGTIHSHPGTGKPQRDNKGNRWPIKPGRSERGARYCEPGLHYERNSLIRYDPATGSDTAILTRRDYQQFLRRAQLAQQVEQVLQALQLLRLP